MNQKEFIEGRMENVPIKRYPNRKEDDPCVPIEKADFRSAVGNQHWVTSQTRFDEAVNTSRFQKRQNNPTWGDYKALHKSIQTIKSTSDLGIKIRKIENPCLATWSDSSLYGSMGEPLGDSDLEGYDRHKVYSQGGCIIGFMSLDDLDQMGDVNVSFTDWRSRASRRVFHSTFGAEGGAAFEAIGMARYIRAYYCDIFFGQSSLAVTNYCEDHLRIVLYTDCRSLFDHLKKDGSVPEDKYVAINVAALRCAVSAGPERNTSKSECRWLAAR